MKTPDHSAARSALARLTARRGVSDPLVLAAVAEVPRHLFIPERFRESFDPYGDHPGPIGEGQTISQPSLVAYMSEWLRPGPGRRILEVGLGSGYQAAILAATGAEVCGVELIPALARHARRVLDELGYGGVKIRVGDGARGWPEQAPFDGIVASCAPERIPPPLLEQLGEGGRMIIPVGSPTGRLVRVERRDGEFEMTPDLPVRFVPLRERA